MQNWTDFVMVSSLLKQKIIEKCWKRSFKFYNTVQMIFWVHVYYRNVLKNCCINFSFIYYLTSVLRSVTTSHCICFIFNMTCICFVFFFRYSQVLSVGSFVLYLYLSLSLNLKYLNMFKVSKVRNCCIIVPFTTGPIIQRFFKETGLSCNK